MYRKAKSLIFGFMFVVITNIASLHTNAQSYSYPGEVDVFMGVDFNCRDIYFNNRVYDVLVNLTPGVRWNMGRRWEVAVQLYVPVINQYGDKYKYVRFRVASISKQLAVGNRWKMKFSGGIFTAESYGIDMKNLFIIKPWLAITAQIGLTGYMSMGHRWEASPMKKVTFAAGPEFYLSRWNTQFSLRGGRYLFNDYGVEAEAFRHFRHVSVGVFASYSDLGKENAGFKVIVMIPPYKRKHRRINFRPASNFRLRYSVEAVNGGLTKYQTDPEENEREGWFDRTLIPWGTDLMESDFKYAPAEIITDKDNIKRNGRKNK